MAFKPAPSSGLICQQQILTSFTMFGVVPPVAPWDVMAVVLAMPIRPERAVEVLMQKTLQRRLGLGLGSEM